MFSSVQLLRMGGLYPTSFDVNLSRKVRIFDMQLNIFIQVFFLRLSVLDICEIPLVLGKIGIYLDLD